MWVMWSLVFQDLRVNNTPDDELSGMAMFSLPNLDRRTSHINYHRGGG